MKTKLELTKLGYLGRISEEDLKLYMNTYADDFERAILTPAFKMDNKQSQDYDEWSYNKSVGDLQGYDCPLCKNRGNFCHYENGYRFIKECKCMNTRKSLKNIEKSGLGGMLKKYTFENYKIEHDWQQDVYDKAKKFVTSDDKWFALLGVSGSGKSHAGTMISGELLKNGHQVKYMLWVNEVTKLLQNKMNNPYEYQKTITELENVEVLYIDDFFKKENNTKPTSAEITIANEILNTRYYKAMESETSFPKTIISSERTIPQLMEYDMATAGRIVEMTRNNLVLLNGNDKNYRLKFFNVK